MKGSEELWAGPGVTSVFLFISDFFPFLIFHYRCKVEGKREGGRFAKFQSQFWKRLVFSLIWLLNAWPAAKAVNRGLIFFSLLRGRAGLFSLLILTSFFLSFWAGNRATWQRFFFVKIISWFFDFLKRQITIIVGEGGHIIIMVCGSGM